MDKKTRVYIEQSGLGNTFLHITGWIRKHVFAWNRVGWKHVFAWNRVDEKTRVFLDITSKYLFYILILLEKKPDHILKITESIKNLLILNLSLLFIVLFGFLCIAWDGLMRRYSLEISRFKELELYSSLHILWSRQYMF